MQEYTLGIIKPDAVAKNCIGNIIAAIEEAGLTVAGLRMVRLTPGQAQGFYHVHRERPFFDSLVKFMSEGPIVVMALHGNQAIPRWRELMGATDPARAQEGSLRKRFAENIERNAVHGSDSPESARFEVSYFFNQLQIETISDQG